MTILIFIAVLAVLVLVHEAGHFFVARAFKIRVFEFGFGFPPRLIGWKKIGMKWKKFVGSESVLSADEEGEGTTYSLNALPIGGFVRIYGEQGEDKTNRESFASRPFWQRSTVILAGVFCNVVLAWVLITSGFVAGLPTVLPSNVPSYINVRERHIQIGAIEPNSPAAVSLLVGDVVLRVDAQNISSVDMLPAYIRSHGVQPMVLTIQRGDVVQDITITPKLVSEGDPHIGVQIMETGIISMSLLRAMGEGARSVYSIAKEILVTLGLVVVNLVQQKPAGVDLSGPVGIAVMTGQVARLGFMHLIQFMAMLSINLALINVLPIPALDGGRFLFLIIERIRGKAVKEKVENAIHATGFALLILLVLVVTYRDIGRYGGAIVEAVRKLF